jgi:hypothetical protein
MDGPDADAPGASARRLLANRANARLSTGPRTRDGKERAARNALRHGLSLGSGALAELAPDIERLAVRLAGEGADQACRELAWGAAEAQVDLVRIRQMRRALLASALAALEQDERAQHEADRRDATGSRSAGPVSPAGESFRTMLRRIAAAQSASGDVDPGAPQKPGQAVGQTPPPGAGKIDQLLREMTRLERYERRAFSRRKRALRVLSESQPGAAG